MFQLAKETGSDPRGSIASLDLTFFVGRLFHEAIELLHLDDVPLHAGNFSDTGHPSATIRKALKLHNEVDCRCDLAANAWNCHRQASHTHHLLQSLQRVPWAVRVHGGHGALVA